METLTQSYLTGKKRRKSSFTVNCQHLPIFSSVNVNLGEGKVPLEVSEPLEDKTDGNTKTPWFCYAKLLAKLCLSVTCVRVVCGFARKLQMQVCCQKF